ncbi:hypothetical protein CFP56_035601 [Quercus suber]|uniref:Uncharacterized protein n=1 Tax=Quercus suber TaxID=58331 RepID=A0AAW0J9Y3_QUESU
MEVEPSSEAKELVDSFVALEEEGDECCVVEDVEAPMVLDAASEHDKDAINPKKLETMASMSYQDENTTTASHVDSSSAPINPLECLKT